MLNKLLSNRVRREYVYIQLVIANCLSIEVFECSRLINNIMHAPLFYRSLVNINSNYVVNAEIYVLKIM